MASTWEIDSLPDFPALTEHIEADIVIIGGGLAGMWAAYTLSKAGRRVVVLEAERIGRGATLYTTAFLTHVLDTDLSELVEIYGEKTAKLIWQSHKDAIDAIEELVQSEKIDCEFMRTTSYVYATEEKELEGLEEERKWADKFGFDTVVKKETDLGFESAGAWEVRQQAKYHPIKFFKGLVEAAQKNGAEIYEQSEVTDIKEEGATVEIELKNGKKLTASDVIIATYEPLRNDKTRFKKGMYLSYVYELKAPRGSLKEGLYEDTKNPYHYFRVDALKDHDRIIIGGEDHRAELGFMEDKSFAALEDFIQKTFPDLDYTIVRKWQGGILEPSDGLALIGNISDRLSIASAFSGTGMTYSAIGGQLLADLILGTKNPYAEIYDPKRTLDNKALLEKAKDYTEEFFGGAVKNLFK